MKRIVGTVVIALFMLGGARGAAAHHTAVAHADSAKSPAAAMAGHWRGTSLCVDLKIAPACHDEQVLYTITPVKAFPDSVTMNADKLVNGKWEFMGAFELQYETAARQWRADFRAPNGMSGRWWFVVHGDSLTGGLLDLPTRAPVRAVRTARAR